MENRGDSVAIGPRAVANGNGSVAMGSGAFTTGKFGGALSFNGTNAWVTVPDASKNTPSIVPPLISEVLSPTVRVPASPRLT